MVFQILLCKVGFLIFLLAFFILFILNILAIRNSHIIKQHVTAIENSFQRDLKPRLLFQGLFLTESDFGHSRNTNQKMFLIFCHKLQFSYRFDMGAVIKI